MRELTNNELGAVSGGNWISDLIGGATSTITGLIGIGVVSYTAGGMATITTAAAIGLGLGALGGAIAVVGGIIVMAYAINEGYALIFQTQS